ncbi:hypothetical protein ACFXAO_03805 [Streptomyces lavendulae]|uniref:hypothetical protein n=1 Tax=Streptomyces lavendulae TaxID=1914 RepID=UPI0036CF1719
MGVHLLPREYHTRTNRASVLVWAGGIPLAGFLLKIWTESFPFWLQLSLTFGTGAAFLFLLWVSPRCFTSVDRYGVSWRSVVRIRRLDWADVYDIRTVTPPAPATGHHVLEDVVYVYRADGRRFPLPYLNAEELGEDDLRREVTFVRNIMDEQRGGVWVADPRVEAHIAWHAARYARRYRALTSRTGIAMTVIVTFAIIFGLVVAFR